MSAADRACAKDHVAMTYAKIVAVREAAGLETADLFQSQEKMQIASLVQR